MKTKDFKEMIRKNLWHRLVEKHDLVPDRIDEQQNPLSTIQISTVMDDNVMEEETPPEPPPLEQTCDAGGCVANIPELTPAQKKEKEEYEKGINDALRKSGSETDMYGDPWKEDKPKIEEAAEAAEAGGDDDAKKKADWLAAQKMGMKKRPPKVKKKPPPKKTLPPPKKNESLKGQLGEMADPAAAVLAGIGGGMLAGGHLMQLGGLAPAQVVNPDKDRWDPSLQQYPGRIEPTSVPWPISKLAHDDHAQRWAHHLENEEILDLAPGDVAGGREVSFIPLAPGEEGEYYPPQLQEADLPRVVINPPDREGVVGAGMEGIPVVHTSPDGKEKVVGTLNPDGTVTRDTEHVPSLIHIPEPNYRPIPESMRSMIEEEYNDIVLGMEEGKKGKAVNPWAVCTDKVGREDKAKYESCVKKVKSKHKIKKD